MRPSSIRRRSAAWPISLDSMCRSRKRASASWMICAAHEGDVTRGFVRAATGLRTVTIEKIWVQPLTSSRILSRRQLALRCLGQFELTSAVVK